MMKWLCLFLLFALQTATAQVNLTNGLVAYYPFNGNAKDESGNNHHPSKVNAPFTADRFGKAKSACSFDGKTNFIQVPDHADLHFKKGFSISAWVMVNGYYNGKCHGNRIIMKGSADYDNGNYLLTFDDNHSSKGMNCENDKPDKLKQSFYAPWAIPLQQEYIKTGKWYLLTYTYDGHIASLYVDCKLSALGSVYNYNFSNTEDLFFGKMDNDQYPYWFNGLLDEVRIYNRALKKDEITALCNSKQNGTPQPRDLITNAPKLKDLNRGLVAWYPFNGNAKDVSGNNNHTIFNNATLTEDRFGNKKSAYYFNGKDNYMQVKNKLQLSPDELTLVAIVKPMDFYKGTCYNNSIIDKGSWDYRSGAYSLRFTAGEYTNGDCYEPALKHQNFVGMSSDNGGSTSRNNYVKLNNWYCVVYTFKNKESKLYLDGKLITTTQHKGPIGKNNEDIFIGKKDNEQYPYWFNGVMDDIRIYNRALTPEEVKDLCNLPKTKTTEPACPETDKPSADFNYTISTCNNVLFESLSPQQKNIKSFKWTFGDGIVSYQSSPRHVYTKPGKYTAKLVVTNQSGCTGSFSKELEITTLKTDFTFTEPGEPGSIRFQATHNNAFYSWDFGDGNTARHQTMSSHSYTQPGRYTVRMFAQNSSGCRDTIEKKINIVLPVMITEVTQPDKPVMTAPPLIAPLLQKREKDMVRNIMVDNELLAISLYDNGIIDGDSVTLIYNNVVILANQLLGSKPLTLQLKVDQQLIQNELVMYAENLGSISPNTALLIITDGNNRHEVNLSSNIKSNGSVSFTLKSKAAISSQ